MHDSPRGSLSDFGCVIAREPPTEVAWPWAVTFITFVIFVISFRKSEYYEYQHDFAKKQAEPQNILY